MTYGTPMYALSSDARYNHETGNVQAVILPDGFDPQDVTAELVPFDGSKVYVEDMWFFLGLELEDVTYTPDMLA